MSGSHDAGALALVKHRGKINGATELSIRLALCVQSQLVGTVCRELPTTIDTYQVDRAVNEDVPGNKLQECSQIMKALPMNTADRQTAVCAEMAIFRAEARQALTQENSSADGLQQVIQHGLLVDSHFVAWTEIIPDDWPWQSRADLTLHPGQKLESYAYRGRIDAYQDLWIVSLWSCHRTCRLKLHKVIMSCIDRLHEITGMLLPDLVSQRQVCQSACQEMVDDICGSIPAHLGTKDHPGLTDEPAIEFPTVNGKEVSAEYRRVAAALGGWILIEPFYEPLQTCLSVERLREGQKKWIKEQLCRIGRLYRVPAEAK